MGSTLVALPLQAAANISGTSPLQSGVLKGPVDGFYTLHVSWQTGSPSMHTTQIRLNGTTRAETALMRGGHLTHSLYMTTADSVSVFVSLTDLNPAAIDLTSTRTYVTIVMM